MSITTTHRDFFLALEGPVNLAKFKQFRTKFHPDLTLYGGKSEGWKKQKIEMETMRALYQGQRNEDNSDNDKESDDNFSENENETIGHGAEYVLFPATPEGYDEYAYGSFGNCGRVNLEPDIVDFHLHFLPRVDQIFHGRDGPQCLELKKWGDI